MAIDDLSLFNTLHGDFNDDNLSYDLFLTGLITDANRYLLVVWGKTVQCTASNFEAMTTLAWAVKCTNNRYSDLFIADYANSTRPHQLYQVINRTRRELREQLEIPAITARRLVPSVPGLRGQYTLSIEPEKIGVHPSFRKVPRTFFMNPRISDDLCRFIDPS